MFRYESTNKNNEKDKKNSIDIDDFEKLYELLKKRVKKKMKENYVMMNIKIYGKTLEI